MKKSKFQFTDPELEKLEFDINTEYNADKFDGIVLESHTQVMRNDSNEAYVALTLRIGGGNEENQPFNILVKMSANFSWEENLEEKLVPFLSASL